MTVTDLLVQVNIDYTELEEQFAEQSVQPKPCHTSPTKGAGGPGHTASVLDMDRARNVGVLMRSLKMDISALKAAICALLSGTPTEHRALEEFEIEGVLAAFPTPGEAKKLKIEYAVKAYHADIPCVLHPVLNEHATTRDT